MGEWLYLQNIQEVSSSIKHSSFLVRLCWLCLLLSHLRNFFDSFAIYTHTHRVKVEVTGGRPFQLWHCSYCEKTKLHRNRKSINTRLVKDESKANITCILSPIRLFKVIPPGFWMDFVRGESKSNLEVVKELVHKSLLSDRLHRIKCSTVLSHHYQLSLTPPPIALNNEMVMSKTLDLLYLYSWSWA